MVMVQQRTSVTPVPDRADEVEPVEPVDAGIRSDDAAERRLRTMALTGAGVFIAILVAFWAWWPAGVVLGLVVGTLAVLQVGRVMQEHAFADSVDGFADTAGEEELREEFDRLRASLGDDWPAFRRAAVLVTRAQWASVAGLQRELRISTAAAQHIMGRLEREGFVGPSRGSRPRVVRLARERAAELESLMGS
jgi:DNA segregation ATPase FtsK/SpoIIIE-like protein